MGRWGVVVGCTLLAACGSRTERSRGTGISEGASPGGGSGATDGGGAPSCTPSRLVANAGAGAGCGVKPVLGTPLKISIDTTDVGEDAGTVGDQACLGTRPGDGEGNVLAYRTATINNSPRLYFDTSYTADGARLGAYRATVSRFGGDYSGFYPLANGWLVTDFFGLAGSSFKVGAVTPSLTPKEELPSFIALQPSGFFRAPRGGMAAYFGRARLAPDGGFPCAPVGEKDFPIVLARFDAQGRPDSQGELGCIRDVFVEGPVAENLDGDVVAIVDGQFWHLAAGGTLTHVPFDRTGSLFPLIDGSFALNDGQWSATAGLDGSLSPPPCWLADRGDVFRFDIVLGGRAYALFHDRARSCDEYLELVLTDGTTCGFVPLPGISTCDAQTVAVGLDGTISSVDPAACTMFVWTGALGPTP